MNFIVDENGTYFKEVKNGVYIPNENKKYKKEKITNYERLEQAVLDCIIYKPELLESTKLEEKYFKKYKRLWVFLKECYKRFGSLDISLMASVCPNACELIDYVADVMDGKHYSARFEQYQEQLIELYDDYEEIEKLYQLSKKLYIREINLENYKKEIKRLLGVD